MTINISRRQMIKTAGFAGLVGICGHGVITRRAAAQENEGIPVKPKTPVTGSDGGEVTPPEDLMREHGVLDRVLLIYEAVMRKFAVDEEFDQIVLKSSAEIVRDFIENYHEKLEENYVFPRFKNAGRMADFVDTLLKQHVMGRRVTARILQLAQRGGENSDTRRQLTEAMQAFIRMYRPHAAREDTDLFPKLKDVVSLNEYDSLAEEFEKQEHKLFGDDGFDKMADRVAKLEQAIGIYDLGQFTPS